MLENRGAGAAHTVGVRFVGDEDAGGVVVTTRDATVTPDPILGASTATTTPFVLDLTTYDWATLIYLYFDITYQDAAGSEYLIHR